LRCYDGDIGKEVCALNAAERTGLLDAKDRGAQIAAIRESLLDELLQIGIDEHAAPIDRGVYDFAG
jgi:hypothetical protein